MAELHQILAVEGDLKNRAMETIARVRGTFADGGPLLGQFRRYHPLTEDGEPQPDEVKALVTRVTDELADVRTAFGEWLDVAMQKEVTNQAAVADLVVDGKSLYSNLPAPALLNLESKLAELRGLLAIIPTNDPAERWEWDTNQGIYVSAERTSYRTQKVPKTHVAYEATKEHPAQVQVFTEDVRVGEWTTILQSGMLSPTDKKAILDRIDRLARAVKQARQKANSQDVTDVKLASLLFGYIFGE